MTIATSACLYRATVQSSKLKTPHDPANLEFSISANAQQPPLSHAHFSNKLYNAALHTFGGPSLDPKNAPLPSGLAVPT